MFYTIENEAVISANKKETLQRFYSNIKELPEDYEYRKYIVQNGELVLNPNFEKEKEEEEKEILMTTSLSKREIFLAIYKDKGLTPDQIKAQIEDPEALIEFEYATSYFRGNPLVNAIGTKLGYSEQDIDYLFLNKELPKKVAAVSAKKSSTVKRKSKVEDEIV